MKNVRKANIEDLPRIAEIFVFNYRLNFYPIFRNDDYYFNKLQVTELIKEYKKSPDNIYVYDDGAVKGFFQVEGQQLKKLFVEPVLQGNSVGTKLIDYAIKKFDVKYLWVLEKNQRATAFYKRHGFYLTSDRKYEDGTDEYLILMKR